MDKKILSLFKELYDRQVSPEEAYSHLKFLPFQDIEHSKIDTHREIRGGLQEVVFGQNKDVSELKDIIGVFLQKGGGALVTRVQKNKAEQLVSYFNNSKYFERSKLLVVNQPQRELVGNIVVLSAGTSDFPVAEEAHLTATFFGSNSKMIVDVGVAGIHRLLNYKDDIQSANVIVAVAGMEGALPSVVAGIFCKPIIAVPTSVGYGANFAGVAPLLTMLNSCAPGIAVVNIDNGFGAGVYAHMVNSLAK